MSTEQQGATQKPTLWPEQVMGGKYVRLLEKHLEQLRDQDAHGNRRLFLDDVFVTYLLAFFNPSIRSLRTIEDFSQCYQAQKHLSIRKICKSTLSDFNKLADPTRLEPIIAALRSQLNRKASRSTSGEHDLQSLLKITIAVDGTFLPAIAQVTWAVLNTNHSDRECYRARVDAHINVSSWLPEAIVVPDSEQSEADSAAENIQPNKIYIFDRAYMSYELMKAHYRSDAPEWEPISHFVIRFKTPAGNSPELQDATELELSEEDRQAGVVSDRVGYFLSDGARRFGTKTMKLREVIIPYEDQGKIKQLRLITNLFDVPAYVIALLYRMRWQVELFFRWFKSFANFGHLISCQREGVLAHLYVTIIAALLMYLHTGFRPSKYLFALLSQVAAGAATLDEIIPILRERERRSELDRQSRARRAAKKLASN